MKNLIIMRHAKSSWENENLTDFDRPLNKRGEKDAAGMGEFLLAKNGTPDLIITSSAKRTAETARITAEKMNYPVEKIKMERKLYLAWVNEILESIFNLSNDVNNCIIIGHNPGMTDLINYFGVRLDNLPTASVVCFEFDVKSWEKLSRESADLKWFQFAKNL